MLGKLILFPVLRVVVIYLKLILYNIPGAEDTCTLPDAPGTRRGRLPPGPSLS